MFFYDKKDYTIEPNSRNGYSVWRPDQYGERIAVYSAVTVDQCVVFICRFTEPNSHPSTFFDSTCSCGVTVEGWDFKETDGIVFEICNKCNKPIYEPDRKALNQKSMEEFDLDAFLAM